MNADRLPEMPSDLKSFEAGLAALAPASAGLNRDELMYRAGWAACAAAGTAPMTMRPAGRTVAVAWLWPLTTAGLVLLSATLGIVLVARQPEVEVVYVEKPVDKSIEAEKQRVPAAPATLPARDHRVASSQGTTEIQTAATNRPKARFGNDYLSLRERVLAFGVDVLPSYSAASENGGSPPVRDSRYGALIGQLRGG